MDSVSKINLESKSYIAWTTLYTKQIDEVWLKERPELRNISMLYHALDNEFTRVKNEVVIEIDQLTTQIKRRDYLIKCRSFRKLTMKKIFYHFMARSIVQQEGVETTYDDKYLREYLAIADQPMSRAHTEHLDSDLGCNKENKVAPEIIPAKDQSSTSTNSLQVTSPDILDDEERRCKTPEPLNIPSLLSQISPQIKRSTFFKKRREILSPSLILCPSTVKHKVEKKVVTPPELIEIIDDDETLITNGLSKLASKSPLNDTPEIMESSIVEKTPKLSLMSTRKNKLSLIKKKQDKQVQKQKKKLDSNIASMDIEEMLDFINQSSDEDITNKKSDSHKSNNIAANSRVEIKSKVESENGKRKYAIPESFAENYDRVPTKKETPPKFNYKEIVRGKERKKLKGWSCGECENFYKALDLSPEELQKKMDECSRHRGRCNPREDTYPGFWDLTFGPTPKTPERSEDKSSVFNHNSKK